MTRRARPTPRLVAACAGGALLAAWGQPALADPAPPDDASAGEVMIYLETLDERAEALKREIKDARRHGEDTSGLALEYEDARRRYKSERARLTTIDRGLVGGGASLVGLGSLSLVCSLTFGLLYAATAEDAWGWASLGTLAGGVIGVSAGAPMLSIGLERRLRQPAEIGRAETRPLGAGFSVSIRF